MSGVPILAQAISTLLVDAWAYSFQYSPIILTGGIAGPVLGGGIPIINFLQPSMFATILDLGFGGLRGDQFFARFQPLPGTELGANQVGRYPFANQAVAANAIIREPLHVSLEMICPVQGGLTGSSYWTKLAVMQALKLTLDQHDNMGGTYTVLTPTYIYQNGLRLRLSDISSMGETAQPQIRWQWDFEFPLVTLQQAQQAYNNQMSVLASQTPGPSGVGLNTSGGITSSVIPSATGLTGAGIAGIAPVTPVQSYPLAVPTGPVQPVPAG